MFLHLEDIGLESIDYQGRYSAFSKDLINFFQEFIDLRDNSDSDQKETIIKVRTAFNSKENKNRFISILKKYTGINYSLELNNGTLSFGFATFLNTDSTIEDAVYNDTYKAEPVNLKDYVNKLESLKKDFNKKDGKVKNNFKSKLFKNYTTMYFCVDSAFFCKFSHAKAVDLTAEEITSIVLHECGHTITLMEKIGLLHNQMADIIAPVSINIKSIKEAKEHIADTRKLIGIAKENNDTTAVKTLNFFDKILETMDGVIKEDNVVKRNGFGFFTLLTFLFTFIIAASVVFVFYFILECIIFVASKLSYNISPVSVYNNVTIQKDGDFKNTITSIVNIEYNSDDFVSQHGLGLSLIAALDKVYTNSILCPANAFKKEASESFIHYNLLLSLMWMSSLLIGNNHSPYGHLDQRNEAIGTSILKTLRAAKLPPQMEADLVKEYEAFKKLNILMNKRIAQTYGSYEKFSNIAHKILSLNDFLHFLINGKSDEDYVAIMNAAKHLSNNELVYFRKRIEKM